MKSESLTSRNYIIKCHANNGGRHFKPVSIQEIVLTPDDPESDYTPVGQPSESFGEIRKPLETRGDLVQLKDGSLRITRRIHIGKQIRYGHNGSVFVQVRVMVREYKLLTKRTNNPKLAWVLNACKSAGLRVFVEGRSFHAPVSYVYRDDYVKAWDILGPIDDEPDDAPRFREDPAGIDFAAGQRLEDAVSEFAEEPEFEPCED